MVEIPTLAKKNTALDDGRNLFRKQSDFPTENEYRCMNTSPKNQLAGFFENLT